MRAPRTEVGESDQQCARMLDIIRRAFQCNFIAGNEGIVYRIDVQSVTEK